MIKRKGMNPALAMASKQSREAKLLWGMKKAYELVALNILADKFDFSTEDLELFQAEFEKTCESVGEGYIDGKDDLHNVLIEERNMRVF